MKTKRTSKATATTAGKRSTKSRGRRRKTISPKLKARLTALTKELNLLLKDWPTNVPFDPSPLFRAYWPYNGSDRFMPGDTIPPNFPHQRCWENFRAVTVGSKDATLISNALKTLFKCLLTPIPKSPA